MRCFYTENAHGVYLSAIAIVFANDEAEARDLLYEKLQAEGLWENGRDDFAIKELPMTGAHVLWNGDY